MSLPPEPLSIAKPSAVLVESPRDGAMGAMHLTRLEVHDLRIIQHAGLAPASGLNLVVGANGSGQSEFFRIQLIAASTRVKMMFPSIFES